jgi:hypothetical protein
LNNAFSREWALLVETQREAWRLRRLFGRLFGSKNQINKYLLPSYPSDYVNQNVGFKF